MIAWDSHADAKGPRRIQVILSCTPKHANTEGQSATQYLYIFYYVYFCPRSSSVCSYFIVYGLSDLVSIAV